MATLPKEPPGKMARQYRDRVSPSHILLIARVLAPLVLAAGLFLFRRQIVDLIQSLSGLEFVFTIVHVYSTLGVRLILAALASAMFVAIGAVSFRFVPSRVRTAIFACLCASLVAVALWYMGRGLKSGAAAAFLSGCLIAANAVSSGQWSALLAHPRYGRLLNLFFWLCIGIEVLLPQAYLAWIRRRRTGSKRTGLTSTHWLRILPGAAIAAGAFAAFAPFPMLMSLGQSIFMSPAVSIVFGPEYQVFSRYDVSDLARNPATGDVFLCGDQQDSPKVLRVGRGDVVDTKISNTGNEYCEFAGPRALVTVDNRSVDDLLVIDPGSFQVRNRLRLDQMPYGEIFLAAHPKLNLVAVASEDEGGRGGGPAIRIVDLNRMKVIREIDAEIGYLIADPRRPVIYANHFAMNVGVRAWDMRTGQLLATSSRFGRSDRMAFDEARNEVLATVPESSEIWRLDATTLKSKAPIHTVFGARGLAIDPSRDLLLVASFLTNELDVIDLKTGRSLRRYRLGPWLRDVLVVSDKGVAFVASRYGVYKVNYLR